VTTTSLADALEREHHEIDDGIDAFTSAPTIGTHETAVLLGAIAALRRHIYLEEEFVFPPMRGGGMVAPLFVMVREHAQLWATLDVLESELSSHADDGVLRKRCDELMAGLQQHNPKEEQVIYPQADLSLSVEAISDLKVFMTSGQLPDGWICEGARPR
jgi:regulator of cell morphogenesis and NO signaling